MSINLTLVGQIIAFAMFAWFCMKYVWPPMSQVMKERRRQIDAGLKRAKDADKTLVQAKGQAETIQEEAKRQAAELLDSARNRAQTMVDDAIGKAQTEASRTLKQGKEALNQEMVKSREVLRKELTGLVIDGVRVVTSESASPEIAQKVMADMITRLPKTKN